MLMKRSILLQQHFMIEENLRQNLIYSNQKEFVEHQHYVFDTLWNKSIPAEEKIREIEDGITPEFVGMILDPFEVQRINYL